MSIYSDPVNKILINYPWFSTVDYPTTFNQPVLANNIFTANGVSTYTGFVVCNSGENFLQPVGFGINSTDSNAQITTQDNLATVGVTNKHISMNSVDGIERFAMGLNYLTPFDFTVCSQTGTSLLDVALTGTLSVPSVTYSAAPQTAWSLFAEYHANYTFAGPWAAGSNPTVEIQVTKCGLRTSIHIPAIYVTGNSTSSLASTTVALPSYLRPIYNLTFPCSGGVGSYIVCTLTISTAGIISYGNGPANSPWNTGSQIGFNGITVNYLTA